MKRIYLKYILFLLISIPIISAKEFTNDFGNTYTLDDFPSSINRGIADSRYMIDISPNNKNFKIQVNSVFGNLYIRINSFLINGINNPNEIFFSYNSASTFSALYGLAWQMNENICYIKNNINEKIIIINEDGYNKIFACNNYSYTSFNSYDSLQIAGNYYNITRYGDKLENKTYSFFNSPNHQNITKKEDIYGNIDIYNYNDKNQLVSINYSNNSILFFKYDNNKLRNIIFQNDTIASFEYKENMLTKLDNGNQYSYSFKYNDCLKLSEIIINDDYLYSFFYDTDLQYINKIILPDGSISEFEKTNNYEYNLTTFNDEIYSFISDTLYNTKKIIMPDKSEYLYSWNKYNQLIEYISPNRNSYKYRYSDKGYIISSINPYNDSLTYKYDNNGLFTFSDYNLNEFYTINDKQNTTLILPTKESIEITKYQNGKPEHIIFPNKSEFEFHYYNNGQIKFLALPENIILSFKYDKFGNINKFIDGENHQYYFFHTNHRLDSISLPDNTIKKLYYNNINMLESVLIDNDLISSYKYDKLNRIIKNMNYNTLNINYQTNRILSISNSLYSNLFAEYNYNNMPRKISKNIDLLDATTIIYDKESNIIEHNSTNEHTFFKFNKLNKLLELKKDYIIEYSYDNNSNITSIKYPNLIFDFKYDKINNMNKYIINEQLFAEFSYDIFGGQIKSIIDGNIYHYNRDKISRLISKGFFEQSDSVYIYDNNSNIINIKDAKQNSTKLKYDLHNRLIEKINMGGGIEKFSYDNFNNIKYYINQANDTIIYKYNDYLLTNIIKNNLNTNIKYDDLSRIINFNMNTERFLTFSYNSNNSISQIKDFYDNPITYFYDNNTKINRVIGIFEADIRFNYTFNDISISYNNNTTNLLYSGYPSVQIIKDNNNREYRFEYDDYGLAKSCTNTVGGMTEYFFNNNSRKLSSIILPNGYQHNLIYNKQNYIISDSTNRNEVMEYLYDENHNIIRTKSVYGIINYDFSVGNLITKISSDKFGSQLYEYTPLSKIRKITTPNNVEITYNYEHSYIKSILVDNDTTVKIHYNNFYPEKTNIFNNTFYSKYNMYGQLVSMQLMNNRKIETEYISKNIIKSINDEDGVNTVYEYDNIGRVTIVNNYINNYRKYKYDKYSNIIERTNSLGALTKYTYNNNNMIINILLSKKDSIVMSYNKNNQIKSIAHNMQLISQYKYDNTGLLESFLNNSLNIYNFFRKNNSLIINSNFGNTSIYKYDDNSRLQNIKYTAPNFYSSYIYNNSGAELSSSKSIYQRDKKNRIISLNNNYRHIHKYVLFNSHIISLYKSPYKTSYDATNIIYDNNMRIYSFVAQKDSTYKYKYTPSGQLKSIFDLNRANTSYLYRNKQIISKQINDKDIYYISNNSENLPISIINNSILTNLFSYNKLGGVFKNIFINDSAEYIFDTGRKLIKENINKQLSNSIFYSNHTNRLDSIKSKSLSLHNSYNNNTLEMTNKISNFSETIEYGNNTILETKRIGNIDLTTELYINTDSIGNISIISAMKENTPEYLIQYDTTLFSKTIKFSALEIIYNFDTLGKIISKYLPNGNRIKYKYNQDTLVELIISKDNELITSEKYIYNSIGQYSGCTSHKGNYYCKYDLNNNIIYEEFDSISYRYNYDLHNNRISKTIKNLLTNDERILNYKYNSIKLPEFDGLNHYEYDKYANVSKLTNSNLDETQYIYNSISSITKIIRQDTSQLYYNNNQEIISHNNNQYFLRFTDKNNNTPFKNNIFIIYDSTGKISYKLYYSFTHNSSVLEAVEDNIGNTFYYIWRENGDLSLILNDEGNIINSPLLTAYGEMVVDINIELPIFFKGMLKINDYYFEKARCYSTEIGRFLSPSTDLYNNSENPYVLKKQNINNSISKFYVDKNEFFINENPLNNTYLKFKHSNLFNKKIKTLMGNLYNNFNTFNVSLYNKKHNYSIANNKLPYFIEPLSYNTYEFLPKLPIQIYDPILFSHLKKQKFFKIDSAFIYSKTNFNNIINLLIYIYGKDNSTVKYLEKIRDLLNIGKSEKIYHYPKIELYFNPNIEELINSQKNMNFASIYLKNFDKFSQKDTDIDYLSTLKSILTNQNIQNGYQDNDKKKDISIFDPYYDVYLPQVNKMMNIFRNPLYDEILRINQENKRIMINQLFEYSPVQFIIGRENYIDKKIYIPTNPFEINSIPINSIYKKRVNIDTLF